MKNNSMTYFPPPCNCRPRQSQNILSRYPTDICDKSGNYYVFPRYENRI